MRQVVLGYILPDRGGQGDPQDGPARFAFANPDLMPPTYEDYSDYQIVYCTANAIVTAISRSLYC